ncbi:caspase a-like [Trichomycterus rosablanca]|uniref:caspase a-like n=1 Tax=Trichomycterus rosablanca TaxID=2290929 RepID=UPI002F35E9EB
MIGYKSKMDCDWLLFAKHCKRFKKSRFTCPTIDQGKKEICRAEFSYQDLCHAAQLPSKQKELFEEKLAALTAAKFCKYKDCPGCQSYVERADMRNLCVLCTICTAQNGCRYEFCWKCKRKWRGPVHNDERCGYSDCEEKEIKKIQTEQIYATKEKSSDRKRVALIINNVKFKNCLYNRTGAEKDEASMAILLEGLGYNVIILNDLCSEGMEAALRDFSQRSEHIYSDSTFVVVMSHGGPDGINGINDDETERDIFPVDKIFYYLNSKNCPRLTDKPKIILIQACRGGSSKGTKQHREKDFGCLRSCTPDTVSSRNPASGSIFIQSLVKIFNEHAHEDDIMELFRKDAFWFEEAAKKDMCPYQMPCLERTTLVKKFYICATIRGHPYSKFSRHSVLGTGQDCRQDAFWFEEAAKQDMCPYQMPCLERTTLVKKFYMFPGL